jgi:hypothetical protein
LSGSTPAKRLHTGPIWIPIGQDIANEAYVSFFEEAKTNMDVTLPLTKDEDRGNVPKNLLNVRIWISIGQDVANEASRRSFLFLSMTPEREKRKRK